MVRVWDVPTRVFHWALALAFAGEWFTRDAPQLHLHEFFGYAIGALVAFRVAWGVWGTRWARFASFPLSPVAAWRYVRGLAARRAQRHVGHNPAGSIAIYALLTLNLLNHPAQAEKLLASLPMVGEVLAEDHLLQIRIQLQDVDGSYHHIKDDRVVFIVSGRAVNTSAEPLKGVQIESSLYDATGKPIETKSIYTGNAMSLKIVKDLSSKEISLLQRLEPPKRFEIRPGESAGFSVVFLSPPTGAKEFTARVVAAQSSTT